MSVGEKVCVKLFQELYPSLCLLVLFYENFSKCLTLKAQFKLTLRFFKTKILCFYDTYIVPPTSTFLPAITINTNITFLLAINIPCRHLLQLINSVFCIL